jgi:putative ATP-dependent endonuclease of OLD family
MEEPEIALPPHTQRRVARYVLKEMGQSIVTTHSSHVIEQFEPDSVVMLHRDGDSLAGSAVDFSKIKRKTYMTHRRQFAEAILARAVLVVEGSTEASLFEAVSVALERFDSSYMNLDFSGASIFTSPGDGSVHKFGPIFKTLGKQVFGACDKPNGAMPADRAENQTVFDGFWESPELGIEDVLIKGVPVSVLRAFLEDVQHRHDYPSVVYDPAADDAGIMKVVKSVLKVRKGDAYGYAALVIDHCTAVTDLPDFIVDMLRAIDTQLQAIPEDPATTVPVHHEGPDAPEQVESVDVE